MSAPRICLDPAGMGCTNICRGRALTCGTCRNRAQRERKREAAGKPKLSTSPTCRLDSPYLPRERQPESRVIELAECECDGPREAELRRQLRKVLLRRQGLDGQNERNGLTLRQLSILAGGSRANLEEGAGGYVSCKRCGKRVAGSGINHLNGHHPDAPGLVLRTTPVPDWTIKMKPRQVGLVTRTTATGRK